MLVLNELCKRARDALSEDAKMQKAMHTSVLDEKDQQLQKLFDNLAVEHEKVKRLEIERSMENLEV